VKVEGSSLCFEGEVVALEKGEVLSSVVIQWRDEKIDALIPVATTSWVKVGNCVFVHIPPSHIFLLKGDHGE
jgi:hypothetical protein